MNVYVVYELFSDGSIDLLKIFSSKDKAKEYMELEQPLFRENRQLYIDEVEVE